MRGKILVIEPKAAIRNMVESLLKEQGLEVVSLEQSHKAIDWLSLSTVDLAILDFSLTDPGIFESCHKIRQMEDHRTTPIIVLLTLEECQDEEMLKRAGANHFVVKPFNPRDLLEKIEIYLLEKAATSKSAPHAAIKGNQDKSKDNLGEIFGSGAGLDIDNILSESKSSAGSDALEGLIQPEEEDKVPAKEDEGIKTLAPWEADFAPEPTPEQHDYSWFLGEMQSEAKGEKPAPKPVKAEKEPPPKPAKSEKPPPAKKKGEKQFEVEELGTSKLEYEKIVAQILGDETPKDPNGTESAELSPQLIIGEEPPEPKPVKAKPKSLEQETTRVMPSPREKGAEYQKLYSDLTDKLAARLAKELAGRLKPETIIKLLKEELEKGKS